MSQVRFLDQVSVTAFKADSGAPATGNDAVIPRVILPGTTFTVSKNTNVEVSELIVAEGATLIIEEGDLIVEGPPPIFSHAVLSVTSPPQIFGTLINNGIFTVPDSIS
jgi:hypothetical protein